MIETVIENILEAEKKAEEMIKAASAEAKNIIAKAKLRAEEIIEDGVNSAEKEIEKARATAETKAKIVRKNTLLETQEQIKNLPDIINGKKAEKVILLLTKRIKEKY